MPVTLWRNLCRFLRAQALALHSKLHSLHIRSTYGLRGRLWLTLKAELVATMVAFMVVATEKSRPWQADLVALEISATLGR
jgi:hypothetical protein